MQSPDGPEQREAQIQEWAADELDEYEIEAQLGDEARDDPENWS